MSRSAAALALAAVMLAWPAAAAAQACCAGGALVNPTRLAPYEDAAAGLQLRARGMHGSFDAGGRYTSARQEQELEQDLAASVRVTRRGQAGVLVPFVQTRRVEGDASSAGAGLGDVGLTARYDFALASETLHWPGFALLASVVFPTGQAAGSGTNPAGTDATGTGTLNGSLGVSLEKIHGPLYFALDAWLTLSGDRTVAGFTTAFPPQVTAVGVAGYVFESEAAVALYVSFLDRGNTTLDDVTQPGTELRLTTAGVSGLLPIGELWRLQGTLFADLPIDSLGRNEQASAGLSVALVHLFL
ncbi:MAG TPA: hypothetical protein VN962_09545 [Polyangia bacterium]|nr:hypothetical protein [Polyangia bacterium]